MENRVNCLLNCLRHAFTRALPGVSALLCVSTAFASNCDPSLRNAPAIYEVTVPIRGQNPVRNTFTVPSNADLMVFAQERGADVTLEVLDSSGQSLGRGDNPIRRTAIQRVALSAHQGQRFYIAVKARTTRTPRGRWTCGSSTCRTRKIRLPRSAEAHGPSRCRLRSGSGHDTCGRSCGQISIHELG